MFIKNDPLKLFEELQTLNYDSFLIAENCFPIQRLHVQTIKRNINNTETCFLAIKNIVLYEEKRKQKVFSHFILPLIEKSNINICFDDIVNNKLFDFLIKNNYQPFFYKKNNETIRAAYKIQ